ncbi:Pycsar system effector family protein [Streptosporangium sp. NPDC002721]|uniref:Pycsar system effector family protein n=1 Tax=Streptosporangium sp. NPDC002721 TaxID=3366188 RepID=UPI0036C54113
MSDRNRANVYAQRILGEIREEVNRADTKASIFLGTTGIAVGAVLGGLFAGSWKPFDLGSGEWLWWSGTASIGASICLFLAAVYPRGRTGPPAKMIAFYGDVLAQESTSALVTVLERSSRAELELLADQIHLMSRVVHMKYRLIRAGIWLLAGSAVAWLAAALIG